MTLKIVLGIAVLILLGVTMVQDFTLKSQRDLIRAMMDNPSCQFEDNSIAPDPMVPREQ